MTINNNFFEKYFMNSLPLSLSYDGEGVQFGDITENPDGFNADYIAYERTFFCDRLSGTVHIHKYKHSNAVEWWLTLEAPDQYDSEIVSDLSYCDFEIALTKEPASVHIESARYPSVHYSNGSNATPDDFWPFERVFWPFPKEPYHFHCDGGRSSSGCMPYFNLQIQEDQGFVFSVGWSGQWHVFIDLIDNEDSNVYSVKAKMDDVYFRVHSQEKLELPRMLIFPWEGDIEEAYNSFRAWQLAQAPKIGGKTVEPPISPHTWGGCPSDAHLSIIDAVKRYDLDVDTYWIDAGWFGEGYERSDDDFRDNWFFNVGAWNTLPHLYPKGFTDIAEALSDSKMGLQLWFEMERANSRVDIVSKHREYFIGPKLPFTPADRPESFITRYSLMLNLGYEPARRYITDVLSEHIEKANIKVLRIDFNYDPLPYWKYNDAPDRRGISEIKYIAGLYALMDELLAKYPNLMIDNCASGGRRLDFQFLRRGQPYTRTDYVCIRDRRDEYVQTQMLGISKWIPISGNISGNVRDPKRRMNNFRSHHACANTLDFMDPKIIENEEYMIWCKKAFKEAKRVRPLLCKDFYPLTGCTISKKDWFAYQANDKNTGKGLVLAFRREECLNAAMTFALRGIDEDAEYILEDGDSGQSWTAPGKYLQKLDVHIDEMGQSRIIFYEKREAE